MKNMYLLIMTKTDNIVEKGKIKTNIFTMEKFTYFK